MPSNTDKHSILTPSEAVRTPQSCVLSAIETNNTCTIFCFTGTRIEHKIYDKMEANHYITERVV